MYVCVVRTKLNMSVCGLKDFSRGFRGYGQSADSFPPDKAPRGGKGGVRGRRVRSSRDEGATRDRNFSFASASVIRNTCGPGKRRRSEQRRRKIHLEN